MSSLPNDPHVSPYSKEKEYMLEFRSQTEENKGQIRDFLKTNCVKFDKKIADGMYEAVILLQNVKTNDLEALQIKNVAPYKPPHISPEKWKAYQDEKQAKKLAKPRLHTSYTVNDEGDKIEVVGLLDRLTKVPTLLERWRIKPSKAAQQKIKQRKEANEKKQLEASMRFAPSSLSSAENSPRESILKSIPFPKRNVSFKKQNDSVVFNQSAMNFDTFNGNQSKIQQSNPGSPFLDANKSIKSSQKQQSQHLSSSSIMREGSPSPKLSKSRGSSSIQEKSPPSPSIKTQIKQSELVHLDKPPLSPSMKRTINSEKTSPQLPLKPAFQKVSSFVENLEDKESQTKSIMKLMPVQNLPTKQNSSAEDPTGNPQLFRRVEDSFCEEMKLNDGFKDKSKIDFSVLQEEQEDSIEQLESTPKSFIPRKRSKKRDPNESYIKKIDGLQKKGNEKKPVTNTPIKEIKSKINSFTQSPQSGSEKKQLKKLTIVTPSSSDTVANPLETPKMNGIHELKNDFLANLRSVSPNNPNKATLAKQPISSLIESTIIRQETDGSPESSLLNIGKKSKSILDNSKKSNAFKVLERQNEALRSKSNMKPHNYQEVGSENAKQNDSKVNLTKSQILKKYEDKERVKIIKPNTKEWEISPLDDEEEVKEEQFEEDNFGTNKSSPKGKVPKWGIGMDITELMHFLSSEELLKYYNDIIVPIHAKKKLIVKKKREKQISKSKDRLWK